MPKESFERIISDMLYLQQQELYALRQQWSVKQTNYLHRVQWEITQFNRIWEENNGSIPALTHQEPATLFDGSLSYLIPELLDALTMLLWSHQSFVRLMSNPIPVVAEEHLGKLHFGTEILLNKLNEAVEQSKNPCLRKAEQCLNSNIELDSFALIDGMLDKTIELKTMEETWTDLQSACLEELHAVALRLHHYWQILDVESSDDLRLLSRCSALMKYLILLLVADYQGLLGQANLQSLQNTIDLIQAKVMNFLAQRNEHLD